MGNRMIGVFCASSPRIPQVYFDETAEVTRLLAEAGCSFSYGGGGVGLMGCVADTALSVGAKITGVIPKFMIEVEWGRSGLTDMIITDDMSSRKQKIISMSDAILVLAGSTGTMDELFEALADKKLGLIWKPIVVLNTNGFYTPLKEQLERMAKEGFMTEKHLRAVYFAENAKEAFERLINGDPEELRTSIGEAAVKSNSSK